MLTHSIKKKGTIFVVKWLQCFKQFRRRAKKYEVNSDDNVQGGKHITQFLYDEYQSSTGASNPWYRSVITEAKTSTSNTYVCSFVKISGIIESPTKGYCFVFGLGDG